MGACKREGEKTQELIRNSTIKDYIADIPSLHTLLISDSCFSGSLFVRGFQRDGSLSANELMRLPSRWAICSGRHDETVADGPANGHSPFAQSILDVLEKSEREYITADFLLVQVRDQTRSNYDQLPDGGPLMHVEHKRGQYVFRRVVKKNTAARAWEAICAMPEESLSEVTAKRKEIDGFCEKYPGSIQVEEAVKKGKSLEHYEKYLRLPNTASAQMHFIRNYPDSPYLQAIKNKLETMEKKPDNNKKVNVRIVAIGIVAVLAIALVLFRYLFATNDDKLPLKVIHDPLAGDFILVQGGEFDMGCTPGQRGCDEDEHPVHRVKLDSYYLGKFEVTQAQWKAIMETTPANFRNCDSCPVERVSWYEARRFIRQLNKLSGKRFRLPTEAEWEFAAREGKMDYPYLHSGGADLADFGWYKDNASGHTRPVGLKSPNALGIYDMNGNVWEWCQDKKQGYSAATKANPVELETGDRHVIRGGAWNSPSKYCRVSTRGQAMPFDRYNSIGFRLALTYSVEKDDGGGKGR